MADDAPIGAGDFADRMARLGGFEPRPRLAVGVSGGADSLALCLLADQWARARGGAVLALTVDHRLRPESADEAIAVGERLAGRGIAHAVLAWSGAKPATGIQEAAREARYRLLTERCAREGILHLLLAHHREDQAETLLLRLAHGSGVDGLAAMAAVREVPELRLLRPLLDQPKARLAATCRAAGLPWLEDPSNASLRFARGRLRAAGDALGGEGLGAGRLAATARRLGLARAALDRATAALLGRAVTVDPAGFLRLDPAPLAGAPAEIGHRALARCLRVIGGGGHPPRSESLDRLFGDIAAGLNHGRTLAGCRVLPYGRHLLVVRESVGVAATAPLPPGVRVWWDRRFLVRVRAEALSEDSVFVGALGDDGWLETRARVSPALRRAVPDPARAALPALWDGRGVLAAPHLGYIRPGREDIGPVEALFAPAHPLAGAEFAVA